jgi:hypothetical protein
VPPIVDAIRYVAPLREGGSLPAIVDTDPPGRFVVKFRGAGQGPKALVAEALCAGIGDALGLPVPATAFVKLAEGFGLGEPDPEIQDLLRGSVGINFGMTYLPGAIGYDVAVDQNGVDPDLAAAIVWFDAFLTNPDRTVRNPNLLVWEKRLWLIDHGAALYFHHRWAGWEQKATREFPQIRDHILIRRASDLAGADARLAPRLSETLIRQIVSDVPGEWIVREPPFSDVSAQREAYAEFLLARLGEPRAWVAGAIDAKRNV